jgi:trans-2-enoyl-CoA reductase
MFKQGLSIQAAVRRIGLLRRGIVTDARAMVYSSYGEPGDRLRAISYQLPDPKDDQVVLRLLAAPINPSDVNQVQGVYPARPPFTNELDPETPSAVGGNEGVFEVIEVGKNVTSCKVGDWTLPAVGNFGTWRSHVLTDAKSVNALPNRNITPIQAATVSVNPATAHQMLREFADMRPGDFFIQNGANSGVGRAAIQLGHLWGLKSINVVRDRPDLDALKSELTSLGADYVVTEEEIGSKSIKPTIKEWTKDSQVKLALNGIGGKSCTSITRQLSPGGHLVTYGAMSKQPISLPTGLFIFSDIHAHGYWLSGWAKKNPDGKFKVVTELLDLMSAGKVKDTPVTPHAWSQSQSLEEFGRSFLTAMDANMNGKGKQLMLFK